MRLAGPKAEFMKHHGINKTERLRDRDPESFFAILETSNKEGVKV